MDDDETDKYPTKSSYSVWWDRLRSPAATAILIALLGVGGYDVRQVSTASERLSAVVQTEHDDQAYFRDLDKRVVLLQEEVDYPHLHGAACLCRDVIGGKQETMRITLGADCDARMIADLEKAFPVSCRRDE